jgi:hypothetical protein
MTPAAIIRGAAADGVSLILSPAGTIKAAGDQEAVDRWLPVVRENKPGIVVALASSDPFPPLPPAAEARRRKVLALARDGKQYTIYVEDHNTDPVLMALATSDGTCELLIPQDRYDAFRVLEMVRGWEA